MSWVVFSFWMLMRAYTHLSLSHSYQLMDCIVFSGMCASEKLDSSTHSSLPQSHLSWLNAEFCALHLNKLGRGGISVKPIRYALISCLWNSSKQLIRILITTQMAILIALAISPANIQSLSLSTPPPNLFLIILAARSKTFPRTRYCLHQWTDSILPLNWGLVWALLAVFLVQASV